MRKRDIFMLSALAFFMGIVCGFLISPAKQGFGNNINYYCRKMHSTTDEA